MFNLEEKLVNFHYPVRGQSNQKEVSFMGLFKAYETDAEIDAIVSQISDEFERDPNGIGPGMRRLAAEFFLGWVNAEGQEDFWVTSGDGTPLEATPELIEKMLSKPGVAVAIAKAFQEARFATESAQLGNSQRSRRNGFVARTRAVTPPG